MATITLNLPDDLAQKLQELESNILIEVLRKTLTYYQVPATQANILPEPRFQISKEEWKKRLLKISAWSDDEIHEIEKARE